MESFDWLSDLSPLHTAHAAWLDGSYQEESLFHLVYRPRHAPFAIFCGAGLLAEHVRRFRFSPDIIRRLIRTSDYKGGCMFSESFLNYLQRMRLRVDISAPPEGMLLLPGEPLLVAQGPLAQVLLLESAFRWLIWRSTQWATHVAARRWEQGDWKEEDAPVAPATPFIPDGWKIRAEYIGGASADKILDTLRTPSRLPDETEGLICIWRASKGALRHEIPFVQARRLYKAYQALGDVWLTAEQEESAGVSRSSVRLLASDTGKIKTVKYTRFQNLYQPLLVKGKPIAPPTRISYFRQRALKQLYAFQPAHLKAYPYGWYV